MRMWKVLIPVLLVLLLAAPAAMAKSSVTVKGHAVGAKELSSAVTLPNGQTSHVTFTLRKSGGAKVTGYAVSSTKYYESYGFGGYHKSGEVDAFAAYNVGYAGAAKFVYTVLRGDGRTYKVLKRVYYTIDP